MDEITNSIEPIVKNEVDEEEEEEAMKLFGLSKYKENKDGGQIHKD